VKSIYVGNLPFAATEDEIRGLFEQYGAVERVSLIRDRETGQSRGFGFVEMPDDAAAERAIGALNNYSLSGRNLAVNEARPKLERSAGAGGGGGRSRREPRW
jgi:RNA recognition motif-containing protein